MAKINYILDERSYIVIRDRIATILIDELRNQFAMTYDETLDAQIYVDRSRAVNPQETPLVNITLPEGSYDNQTVIKSDGTFTYEIDCYYSQGYSDGNGGDVASRFNATKLMSACQAILENPIYIKLDFDGPFIMSSHVTNFQVGTIDREDATSIAVATFNLVVKATQSEPVGVGILIAGSNTIANIEGGPQRLIYEGDATPTPPPVAPGSTVFNTDGKTLGIGPSGGSFIVDDSTYIITDSVGNVLYSGSIPATDEFIQVISNATVTNSLGSTLASIEAQGTAELADVPNIDSDGSTVPTPAGVPFTCTPAETVYVGKELMKSGQTESNYIGDDGDIQAGRPDTFFVLGGNNPFGNPDRFTDTLGGQTYANNIMIDWSTYDNDAVLGYYMNILSSDSFTNQISIISALNIGGFTNWRMWNSEEMFNALNKQHSILYNYSPLNWSSGFGGYAYTSTTRDLNFCLKVFAQSNQIYIDTVSIATPSPTVAVRTFTVTGTTLT